MTRRIAILSTHPIQYQAPWFRTLASHPDLDLEVLFCHKATPAEQSDAGFGVEFDWDISLLDGYSHRFLKNIARVPTTATFNGLDTPEIASIIRKGKYDAVVVNGWHYKSAWQAIRACWRTKTPAMARSDSHLHTSRGLVKRTAKWPFYHWFIPKLAACLPVGAWSRDYFLHYGAQPERVFIVPHVVDTDYFSSESAKLLPLRSELRAQWGFDNNQVIFLFAGKFIEKKRPMDFLRALKEAVGETPVAGLMVGDGPLRRSCEDFVASCNAPVRFAGFLNQSEITKAYAAADALVLPSNGGETWGLVANEAMASGRPCFVSDHVGCGPDLIMAGQTGQVFRLGDVHQLTELMRSYSDNPDLLRDMGRKAQEQIRKQTTRPSLDNFLQAVNFVTTRRHESAIQSK